MNLFSKNRPRLWKQIIRELFTQKNKTYSLEHYSVNKEEYEDIIDFIHTQYEFFNPVKYFVFPVLDGSNEIYFTFSNGAVNIDIDVDISTGNVSFY